MDGTHDEWNRHWQLRSGQIEPQPQSWAMRAGAHMESLILDWYGEQIGQPITRRPIFGMQGKQE